ncbi:hypothetical protein [Paraburkholderia sp. C35]|uniref:hypothetical protein n=1 Tax=Paraburkholderia sp. C35 TaxID=2126993 RepID=UPI000D689797|nr:hypothetical protein [Paraburkholderia sp. C35]
MRSFRVPSFRSACLTDGAVWMWWLLAASLLRVFGDAPHATILMVVGVLCFARWSWTTWRSPAPPSWVPLVEGVSDAEVFAVGQLLAMALLFAGGDLAGAVFAALVAAVCWLRAWSWQAMLSRARSLRAT